MLRAARQRKAGPTDREELPSTVKELKDHKQSADKKRSRVRRMLRALLILAACLGLASRLTAFKVFLKNIVNNTWLFWENLGFLPFKGPFQTDFQDDYPELHELSLHVDTIRDEMRQLLDKHENDISYLGEINQIQKKGDALYQIYWKTFFIKHGDFIPQNAALVPKTTALLEKIPYMYTAFYSILGPHDHIQPHWGYWKGYLRYQLALQIPEGDKCWLRLHPKVGRNATRTREEFLQEVIDDKEYQEYRWTYGEAVLFDDTTLHEVKNDSDETRVVLFLDFARNMPWWLALGNHFALWLAFKESSLANMRIMAVLTERDASSPGVPKKTA